MEKDLKHSRISVIVHAFSAAAVAYASASISNTLYAGALGIAVLIAAGYPLEKAFGKRGFRWWFTNGIFIYLFVWLVGWIYFFNAGL
jgi:hypothetical protein